jgi:hypothetical protein
MGRNLLKHLQDAIYGGEPAAFVVDGSPEEAAHRLAAETRRLSLSGRVVGSASVERVVLRRQRLLWSNSFAPVFRGRFTTENGRTVLRGHFQLRFFVQAFMTFWFAGVGFFVIALLTSALSTAAKAGAPWWRGLLYGFGASLPAFLLAFLGLGVVLVGRWLGRSDIPAIRCHVTETLQTVDPSS